VACHTLRRYFLRKYAETRGIRKKVGNLDGELMLTFCYNNPKQVPDLDARRVERCQLYESSKSLGRAVTRFL
jgi:hypothetical protein